MRVHYLQHVPFEGLGSIEPALLKGGHQISSTHLYKNQPLPLVKDLDWLIVMGGPMGVYDEEKHGWLMDEKRFIRKTINAGKLVLGICLGAQLIADVLGAKVYKNKFREIGWFTINCNPGLKDTILSDALLHEACVFHWHGDTFDIPYGAIPIAGSEACKNQGFILNNRVIALQFHLETTFESATSLIENCRHELDDSPYVQLEEEILSDRKRFLYINQLMLTLIKCLEKEYS